MRKVSSAEEAVKVAAEQAVRASLENTFAVGGVLIDNRTGEVYCALHNDVLKTSQQTVPFLLYDPTGHGERQIVDWYFANRLQYGLPGPDQLTIVTTLDPCAMCAGAILTSGFNVAVSAPDNYAGINFDNQLTFSSLPQAWQKTARSRFGYYAVTAPVGRQHSGSSAIAFARDYVDANTFVLTDVIFDDSVNKIRQLDSTSGLDPSKLSNPETLPLNSKIRQAFRDVYSDAFDVSSDVPRLPGIELAKPLYDVARASQSSGSAFDAVAFLDPFGNVLLCLGGRERLSPIRTAFMEVTRTYSNIRWNLMNDPDSEVRRQAEACLTHPKFGTFVFLYAPDPSTPQGLMVLGAYGSTMEGAVPQVFPSSLQFVLLPENSSLRDLANCAMKLPPFYTTAVQVNPMSVANTDLVEGLNDLIKYR